MWAALSKIHLVDRCLILFMIVLLGQSAYTLFFCSGTGAEINNIDIIVRTSTAGIFGYFLSVNFIRHTASKHPTQDPAIGGRTELEKQTQMDGPRNQIGFAVSEPQEKLERGGVSIPPAAVPPSGGAVANRLQIVTATVIGLFCLTVLILLRNVQQWNPDLVRTESVTATVAQFRDFISGCVGFLIGCPTDNQNPTESSL